ncbi:hypothetical protein ENUP19_0047G0028 [Entamoeba nuttalli]|uniref:Glycerophosphocholine acyltransferase 1 n=2 Tax=Entamoeba nuttalli TaxID=412467 RepID=K2HI10_ENTNP|nr:membrane transporter, putative [Entamoeba nuttalli P19]EKE42609.1 membrane transporter, putative [Entamoeba nuttalli P19]|eukprot:XP_008855044.1 membrane transporter, putative [Entamoeba nuttalli P19]
MINDDTQKSFDTRFLNSSNSQQQETPVMFMTLTEEQLNYIHSFKLGNVKLLDKVTFVIGVCLLTIGEYVILVRPDLMHIFYMCLVIPLVTGRYLVYRMNKWHYFLLDFCYFTNCVLIISCIRAFFLQQNISWIFPTLFVVIFGPLLTAIPMWNNALVFHDLTKLTSITIHLLPGMVAYCIRWYSDLDIPKELNFYNGFLFPLLFYSTWQSFYLIYTEIFKRDLIYDEGYMTSVRWLVEEKPHKAVLFMRKFFPEKVSSLTVMVITQFGMYFATTLPQFYLYNNKKVQTCWMLFCFVYAIWNGANYYFEVFVNRYVEYLHKFKPSQKQSKSKNN